MSRTKRRGGNASPIKRYLQFSGSTGIFSYYDKEIKERVELDELEIIVLDVRASVTGYNSTSKAQITSNLVAETGSEKLTVTSWKDGKSTAIAEGLYKDIKDKVKTAGGKFTSNVICLCDVGNGQEICNLQFQGSSLNGWIKFLDTLDRDGEYDNVITVKRGALSKLDGEEFVEVSEKEEKALIAKIKKNPRTPQPIWFYVLDFDTVELTEEQADLAGEQDEILQTYFDGVSPKPNTDVSDDIDVDVEEEAPTAPADVEEDEKGDLPF